MGHLHIVKAALSWYTVNVINHHFTNNSSVLNNKWENALSIFGRAFWYVSGVALFLLFSVEIQKSFNPQSALLTAPLGKGA